MHPTLSLPQPPPRKTRWNSELRTKHRAFLIRRISSPTMFLSWLVLVIQSYHCALNNDQFKSKGILKVCAALSKSIENKRTGTQQNSFLISFHPTAKVARSLECLSLEESALSEPGGVTIDGCECSLVSLPALSVHGCLSQTAPVKATCWHPFSQRAVLHSPAPHNHTGEGWALQGQCRWQILMHSVQTAGSDPKTWQSFTSSH